MKCQNFALDFSPIFLHNLLDRAEYCRFLLHWKHMFAQRGPRSRKFWRFTGPAKKLPDKSDGPMHWQFLKLHKNIILVPIAMGPHLWKVFQSKAVNYASTCTCS